MVGLRRAVSLDVWGCRVVTSGRRSGASSRVVAPLVVGRLGATKRIIFG